MRHASLVRRRQIELINAYQAIIFSEGCLCSSSCSTYLKQVGCDRIGFGQGPGQQAVEVVMLIEGRAHPKEVEETPEVGRRIDLYNAH